MNGSHPANETALLSTVNARTQGFMQRFVQLRSVGRQHLFTSRISPEARAQALAKQPEVKRGK